MARKKFNRINEVKYNNFGSKMEIIACRGYDDIDVYFEEYNWTFYHNKYDHFKNGSIRCPYEPRFFGIGYIGEGKYVMKKDKLTNAWTGMLRRCYDEKSRIKNPTYIDCTVCKEWHNFQNFAKWYEENYYEIEGQCMQLDKDILIKGNKIYSPQTCIFVPQRINDLFVKKDVNRGELPIGVTIEQHRYKTSYRVSCQGSNNKQIYIGCFDTPHYAFLVYKLNKELVIQSIAKEYKNVIPQKLYESLINYQVEIND